MRRLIPLLFVLCVLANLTAGCRKRRGEGPANPSGPEATEAAASLGIDAKLLPAQQTLYEAITKYMAANQGRAAKDVDELVQKGFLKPLPPLPAGKRYYLDQRAAMLSILDK